ncbi:MAG: fimbrillin family protein [Alistipes sp.]|nr:fimbrillin family protein [Alistipes sp.]
MKRCLLIAAALSAAGCVTERDVCDPVVELGFVPAVYGSVRAAGERAEGLPFRVSAWSLPADARWSAERNVAEEFLAGELVAQSGGIWRPSEPRNWPGRTLRLSFMGYAPSDAGARCDKNDGVVFADVDTAAEQPDLLFTEPLTDVSKFSNGGIVPMAFRHALCEVAFRVHRLNAGGGEIVLRRIVVESLHCRGCFASLASPQWRFVGEPAPQVFFDGEFAVPSSIRSAGESRRVIPQRLGCRVFVEFDYVNAFGGVISQRLSTIPLDILFEAGRRYVCTLTLAPDDVKFLHETMELDI